MRMRPREFDVASLPMQPINSTSRAKRRAALRARNWIRDYAAPAVLGGVILVLLMWLRHAWTALDEWGGFPHRREVVPLSFLYGVTGVEAELLAFVLFGGQLLAEGESRFLPMRFIVLDLVLVVTGVLFLVKGFRLL
jgi:hypothetical protein